MKISYTKLSSYLDCPYKYKLMYKDSVPRETNKYAEAGVAFHKAVSLRLPFYDAEELFKKEIYDPTLRRMASKSYQIILSKYQDYTNLKNFLEFEFETRINDDIILTGVFDVLVIDESNPIGVIDWKLSKSSPTTEKYTLQAAIYYLAFVRSFDIKPRFIKFISPYKEAELSFSVGYLEKISDYIVSNLEMLKEFLETGPYFKSGLFTQKCKFCPVKEHCFREFENGNLKGITSH